MPNARAAAQIVVKLGDSVQTLVLSARAAEVFGEPL